MKVRGYIIALAVAGLGLISCSKETGLSEGGTRVAYIGLAADADGTKSSIDGLNVSWTAGDDILYYTGRYTSGSSTDTTGVGSYKVPEACGSLRLPVEYNNGDNRVTVLTKGRAVGTITPASLNSLTIADAVPASQDGTFASTYIAACEGNLLELTALTSGEPKNLTMTPVQAFVRFKLSSLTVGGQTVNRITVAGKSGGSAVPVCGDLGVSITENGSSTHTVSSAAGSNTGNLITIDKSGSKFNTGEYIYVALLPQQYDELTLTLYNGGNTLATVPVKQGSDSENDYIDLGQGKMVDLGEINAHAVIKFISAKMYPEKVAITKDRSTKKLWLKIEPSDFDVNNVQWSSSEPTLATVPATGTVVTMDGLGKCIEVTVTNKYTSAYTPEKNVTIIATVTDPTDNSVHLSTCKINIGEWLDVGLRNENGKRVLFAHHVIYTTNGTIYSLYNQPETTKPTNDDTKYVRFPWGAAKSNGIDQKDFYNAIKEPTYFSWALSSGESPSADGQYSKYNVTDRLPHLQRRLGEFSSAHDSVDDPCSKWNSESNTPSSMDASNLINNTKREKISNYYKFSGKTPGYTDTWLYVTDRSMCEGNSETYFDETWGFWLCEYEVGFPGMALYFNADILKIEAKTRLRPGVYRPVKYVD